MDAQKKLEDIAKESSIYMWHNEEKYKHKDVFDCIQYAIEHNLNLNDKDFYKGNLVSLLLDIYYNEYYACKVFTEEKFDILINQKSEALIPLEERTSGIFNELMYLKNHNYNFNNYTTLVNLELKDNDQAPVFCVMKWAEDNLMLQWLINNGCKEQMLIPFDPLENPEEGQTLVDWCFDNIDLCMEDIIMVENHTGKDCTKIYKLAADTIRTMLENGMTRGDGLFTDINEDNKISFHRMRTVF